MFFYYKSKFKIFFYIILQFIVKLFLVESKEKVAYIPLFMTLGIGIYFRTYGHLGFGLYIVLFLLVLFFVLFLSKFLRQKLESRNFHSITLIVLYIVVAIFVGYSAALVRDYKLDTQTLNCKVEDVWVFGNIEAIEHREKNLRIYLTDIGYKSYHEDESEDDFGNLKEISRVRVNLPIKIFQKMQKAQQELKINMRIKLKVTLMPPPLPSLPNSFNFARSAYFRGIGAIGYSISQPFIISHDNRQASRVQSAFQITKNKIREAINNRIKYRMEYPESTVAIAILTGDSSNIPQSVLLDMNTAGTAHLKAISGMHMAVAVAISFLFMQFILGLSTYLTLHCNIRKIAAITAIVLSYVYLIITDFPVSAQRAFIVSSIVLIAIVVDRHANPVRSLSVGAILILLISPENIFNPSLQMSFAAYLALINSFGFINRYFLQSVASGVKKKRNAFIAFLKKFTIYNISIIYASILASLATTPFIIYHFNRFSSYSVVANLFCVPISDFIMMPFGMLSLILMPIGLDYVPLWIMEQSIRAILYISHYISNLPNSEVHISSLTDEGLIFTSIGIFLIVIARTFAIKFVGLISVVLGLTTPYFNSAPDIIISGGAKLFALDYSLIANQNDNSRYQNKKLVFSSLQKERYSREIWQQKYYKDFLLNKSLVQYKNNKCRPDICYITKEGVNIVIINNLGSVGNLQEKLPEAWCPENQKIDLFVNMGKNYTCPGSRINITQSDLQHGGTHQITFLVKKNQILVENLKEKRYYSYNEE